jgi:tetratricopeptide (TPR) repeat protein
MHENEILCFTDAIQLVHDKFYVDGINKFQQLVNEFPESDLADDALYNIGLCYFEMNQFNQCIEILEEMIEQYPDATISALESENEFGKTAGKALYLIILSSIALDDKNKVEYYMKSINDYNDTYMTNDGKKITFPELAQKAVKKFLQLIK